MTPTAAPTPTATGVETPQGQLCVEVPPSKEMEEIAKRLRKAAKGVDKSVKGTITRIRKRPECKALHNSIIVTKTQELMKRIETQITQKILKSVQVCGEDCLTVSFEKEVKPLFKALERASKDAVKLARKGSQCAGGSGNKSSTGSAGPRTDQTLKNLVKDTKKIKLDCKVCKK